MSDISTSGLFEIYEDLKKRNIILSFKGDITPDLLTSILFIIEQKLDRYNEESKVKKKVFNVLVECLQNLYHHSDDDRIEEGLEKMDRVKSSVIVMIAKAKDGYNILTGNMIPSENVSVLKNRLEEINDLSKDELKELYLATLTNGKRSNKGGGGLGFLEIARKSGRKLEFGIVPYNDKSSFFSLNVKIEQ
jgi:hypothetical protein